MFGQSNVEHSSSEFCTVGVPSDTTPSLWLLPEPSHRLLSQVDLYHHPSMSTTTSPYAASQSMMTLSCRRTLSDFRVTVVDLCSSNRF